MIDELEVQPGVAIPAGELSYRFSRSSGPGGQNVNKRDTRVEVIFDLDASSALTDSQKRRVRARLGARTADGRLRVASSVGRTQAANRERARARLAALLREALAPPPPRRVATAPTRAARERRVTEKRRRGEKKHLRKAPPAEA